MIHTILSRLMSHEQKNGFSVASRFLIGSLFYVALYVIACLCKNKSWAHHFQTYTYYYLTLIDFAVAEWWWAYETKQMEQTPRPAQLNVCDLYGTCVKQEADENRETNETSEQEQGREKEKNGGANEDDTQAELSIGKNKENPDNFADDNDSYIPDFTRVDQWESITQNRNQNHQ